MRTALVFLFISVSICSGQFSGEQGGSPDLFSDFLNAVYRGDYQKVKSAIESGMSLTWETESGMSPLSIAAASGNDSLTFLLLSNGAGIDDNHLIILAVSTNSLPVLKWAKKHNRFVTTWSWSSTAQRKSPLSYAIYIGSSLEIVDFLLSNLPPPSYSKDIFQSLHYNDTYDQKTKLSIAHKLLNTGIEPSEWDDYLFLEKLASSLGDTTIRKKIPPRLNNAQKQMELNKSLAYRAKSRKSIDSLLALGADPLGSTGGGCQGGKRQDLSTPLDIRRGTGCNQVELAAFNWQCIAFFLWHDPQKIKPELSDRDELYIAITTRNLSNVEKFLKKMGEKFFLSLTFKGKGPLFLAADAGDAQIVKFLLQLQFTEEEKENALMTSVEKGYANVVKVLLASGVDPQLASTGGNGVRKLLQSMLFRSDGGKIQDTVIAKDILSAYKKKHGKKISLPLSSLVTYGYKQNAKLFNYLWRNQPEPLNGDTVFANIRYNLDLLFDTSVMKRIPTAGHEMKILSEFLSSQYEFPEDEDPRILSDAVAKLNVLQEQRIQFHKVLTSEWYCKVGKYHIGYDKNRKQFEPAWIVPSLFSDRGTFDMKLGR